MSRRTTIPDGLPVLAPGRHRRPRKGACLMEYASVLAGERFSDSPACTDPVLSVAARCVNDYSGDVGRQRLAVLAGDLSAAGPLPVEDQQTIARRCLLTAFRYAVGSRRRLIIVALLGLERAAAGQSKGFRHDLVGLDVELALLDAASDVATARSQLEVLDVPPRQHHSRGLATSIELAAATIKDEASDADDVLYDLLLSCLDDHRRAARPAAPSRRGTVSASKEHQWAAPDSSPPDGW